MRGLLDGVTVERLRSTHLDAAAALDAGYEDNADLVISEGGIPTLKRRRSTGTPTAAEDLAAAIARRMPERSLLAIVARTAYWLGWHHHFGPASGSDPKIADPQGRYCLAVFTGGTNIGPYEAARHIAGVSACFVPTGTLGGLSPTCCGALTTSRPASSGRIPTPSATSPGGSAIGSLRGPVWRPPASSGQPGTRCSGPSRPGAGPSGQPCGRPRSRPIPAGRTQPVPASCCAAPPSPPASSTGGRWGDSPARTVPPMTITATRDTNDLDVGIRPNRPNGPNRLLDRRAGPELALRPSGERCPVVVLRLEALHLA